MTTLTFYNHFHFCFHCKHILLWYELVWKADVELARVRGGRLKACFTLLPFSMKDYENWRAHIITTSTTTTTFTTGTFSGTDYQVHQVQVEKNLVYRHHQVQQESLGITKAPHHGYISRYTLLWCTRYTSTNGTFSGTHHRVHQASLGITRWSQWQLYFPV